MKRTKDQKLAFQAYVLDCVTTEGYDLEKQPETAKEKADFVFDTFYKEYGHNVKRHGSLQKAFCEWLTGLPSAFTVDFENVHIIRLSKQFGFIPENANEKQEDRALVLWWPSVFMVIYHIYQFNELQPAKAVFPIRLVREVRRLFWEYNPQFRSSFRKTYRQNQYSAEIRTAFVDFVDQLQKDEQIGEGLANRVTL